MRCEGYTNITEKHPSLRAWMGTYTALLTVSYDVCTPCILEYMEQNGNGVLSASHIKDA